MGAKAVYISGTFAVYFSKSEMLDLILTGRAVVDLHVGGIRVGVESVEVLLSPPAVSDLRTAYSIEQATKLKSRRTFEAPRKDN